MEIITNPEEPALKAPVSSFRRDPSFRFSGSEAPSILEGAFSLVVDDSGSIYVSDSKASNIKVFDSKGNFLRTIGRFGQGPSEFNAPVDMAISAKPELMVYDLRNRRLSFFSLTGQYHRSVSLADISMGQVDIDSKDDVFCIASIMSEDKKRFELRQYDSHLNYLKTIDAYEPKDEHLLSFLEPRLSFALTPAGLILAACPDEAYEIRVYANDGALIKRIRKAFVPVRVPKSEIDFLKKGVPPGLDVFIPEYYAPFYHVTSNGHGRIITLVRVYYEKNIYIFDVFGSDGKYLETKEFKLGHKASRFCWHEDKFYTVEEDEEGMLTLVAYNVTWAAPQ